MNIPFFNYNITNQTNRLEVYIDGGIVDSETQEILQEWYGVNTSVSFKSFRQEILDSGVKDIKITINSMGGQIGDAMAMHDFIQQLENDGYNVETVGIGMVCSAATYILSASKNSNISKNGYYMIHNVSGGVWGNVNEIEQYAKNIRNFNDKVRDFYVNLTGKSSDQVTQWMDNETWFCGQEVVDNGFVKNIISEQAPKNTINRSDFKFKNTTALNAYNAAVKVPENLDPNNFNFENLNINDMNKFVEAIVNAFKTNKLVVTDENPSAEPLNVANLTSALNTAFAGMDLTPEIPEESISNALTNFFKDGLPENLLTQIANAVKPAELDLSKDEVIVNLTQRIADSEEKIANRAGIAKPKGGNSNDQPEDKYDTEGVGWEEKK